MKKKLLLNLTIGIILIYSPPIALADEIKIFLDESHTKFIMVQQQDCFVHKSKDGRITLGFKAGGLFWGMGPEISFGNREGIEWDVTVQGLIARYQELCSRFNTGSLTKQEYESRLKKIEAIEHEAYTLYQEFLKAKTQKRQDVFDELDRETGSIPSFKSRYDRINRQIQSTDISN